MGTSWNVFAMPFSLQLFGGVLLQGTGHSPNENASYQESAGYYRKTCPFFS